VTSDPLRRAAVESQAELRRPHGGMDPAPAAMRRREPGYPRNVRPVPPYAEARRTFQSRRAYRPAALARRCGRSISARLLIQQRTASDRLLVQGKKREMFFRAEFRRVRRGGSDFDIETRAALLAHPPHATRGPSPCTGALQDVTGVGTVSTEGCGEIG